MSEPVRVLIIEDNPMDYELAQREIRIAIHACVFEWVETKQDFLNALEAFQPDLVLSDYNLPRFDGLQALKLLQERAPFTPLILWTGSLNEEIAVESMKAGANNYVIKENIKRLGPAVIHALTERRLQIERKRAEDQIQRQLKRLNALGEINIAITSSLDMNVSLETLVREVLAQLGVDAAAVLLLNTATLTFECIEEKGFRTPAIRQSRLRLGEGFAGQVGSERKVIHIPNLAETGSQFKRRELLQEEEFVEYLGVPLIARGVVKGVLEIFNRSPLALEPQWMNYLETLSRQAAIAIDNAQLIESWQRANAELEQRVAERTLELTSANRAKDEFLATMSHELRTPLNSILGLSETLLEELRGPLNEHQRSSLQIIESSGRHLLELINDVLDLSKIEAGKFDYYPQTVDVDVLCRSSLAFVKEQALRKSITLEYHTPTNTSQIHADPRRLKQILVNLLTNAVKFTPTGGQVTLQVTAHADRDLMQFSIRDTGIGIASEDLQRLFQPFVQVDSKLNRQFEGTGLGLALVQRLTDMHGGSVTVESEVGQGSCFTVNIPWGQVHVAQQATLETGRVLPAEFPEEKPRWSHVVLLAEDNPANTLTIGEYLKGHGYAVVNAHTGIEAIEKAHTTNPSIILMDIQMPALDGLEATRRLRAEPRFDTVPIIALTALAMPGDRERCLAAGANEYMSKPVSLKNLLALISKLLNPTV